MSEVDCLREYTSGLAVERRPVDLLESGDPSRVGVGDNLGRVLDNQVQGFAGLDHPLALAPESLCSEQGEVAKPDCKAFRTAVLEKLGGPEDCIP